jgi:uncharacterized protein YegP (UPF0339 family)
MTFRVVRDEGTWLWEIVASNGWVVAQSRAFTTANGAARSVRRVIEDLGAAFYNIEIMEN